MRETFIELFSKAFLVLIICASVIQVSETFGAQAASAQSLWESNRGFTTFAAQDDEAEFSIYFPTVNQPLRVELDNVWTTESTGAPVEAFLPGKVIRYYGKGYVNVKDGALVNLRWSIIGPCESKVIANENIQINQGEWTLYRTDIAPNCPGIYVYTLRLEFEDNVSFLTIPYVINNPSEISTISRQGFDKCNIPYGTKTESASQMQTWWDASPYYFTNLYIGGVSRYCSNTELDAVWVNMVANQGWSFVPTWVGPQAPCTSFRNKFSYDTTTAYQQGVLEANAAVAATRNLGFLGNAVIYYDMEVYSTTNTECRQAVNSFLTGWTQRIKEYGLRSGVYGHRINTNDWTTIYPIPDSVWIAYWVIPYGYNAYASAYNIPGISDSLWYGHRIRQYTGGHTETYGGLTFNIDSNVAHGDVTVLPNTVSGISGGVAGSNTREAYGIGSEGIIDTAPLIQDIQLLSERTGLALMNYRLFRTEDGGSSWSEIAPEQAIRGTIMDTQFLDESDGWVVSQDPLTGQLDIYQTNDGGKNWQASLLQIGNVDYGPLASAVYLHFLDRQNGWVVVELMSSSNFSIGKLYRTMDGGLTWEELPLPLGEPVYFLDQHRGWIAGGPAGDELYRSTDGGSTWEREEIHNRISQPADHILAEIPVFADDRNGILPVTILNAGDRRVELLRTHNGGDSWETLPLETLNDTGPAGESFISADAGGSESFVIVKYNSQLVLLDNANGRSYKTEAIMPEGTVKIELGDDGLGWAIVQVGDCLGDKADLADSVNGSYDSYQCENRSQILRTTDNGKTWIEITPKP
jgi:photosystem II stability/assembly factor-like uncharacterized protein